MPPIWPERSQALLLLAVLATLPAPAAAEVLSGRVVLAETAVGLVDYQVLAYPGGSSDVHTAVTDSSGAYVYDDIPAGAYLVRIFGPNGVQFGAFSDIVADGSEAAPIEVEPSGVVHDSATGQPVQGAQAWLHAYGNGGDICGDLSTRIGEARLSRNGENRFQQGQVTGPDGLYQFKTPPNIDGEAGYEICIDAPGQRLVFPSSIYPPEPREGGPLGIHTGADPVSVSPLPPDPGTEAKYFLAWRASAGGTTLRKNHIPLDTRGSLIDVRMRARPPTVRLGEVVTYEVEVTNRGEPFIANEAAPVEGGFFIRSILPKGFKYVAGTTRIRTKVGHREFALTESDPRAQRILRFGQESRNVTRSLPLATGEVLLLRFQAQVDSRAKPGTLAKARSWLDMSGNVQISGDAHAAVRVVEDPLFDRGVLLGKVFCDANDNAWQDEGEPGLPGARIYLDTGRWSETGTYGGYHIADIPAGFHLAKLDTASLPPGSEVVGSEKRGIHFTRGLPGKATFAVRCLWEEVGAADVVLNPEEARREEAARRARQVDVEGDVEAPKLAVDDQDVPLLSAKLAVLTAPGTPDFGAAEGTHLHTEGAGLTSLPTFHLRATGTRIRGWRLAITDHEDGRLVREIAGKGSPPGDVTWDGTAEDDRTLILESGRAYQVRLVVHGEGDRMAISPVRALGVDFGTKLGPAVEEILRDDLFKKGKDIPTDLLKQRLASISPKLRQRDLQITVEVHSDNVGDRRKKQDLSQRRAERVKAMLIKEHGLKADKVEALGFGATQPMVPNIGERNRWKNRRVVLLATKAGPKVKAKPIPLPETRRRVRVNHQDVPLTPQGAFQATVMKPPDGRLVVELQNAVGGRSFIHLVVAASGTVGPGARIRVPVVGDLSRRSLTAGGVPVPADLLRVELSVPAEVAPGPVDLRPSTPVSTHTWALEVRGPTGKIVHRATGKGAPPGKLTWSGEPAGGGPQAAGEHTARIEVRDAGGGHGWSPERTFRVTGEAAPPPPKGAKGFTQFALSGALFSPEGRPLAKLTRALQRRIKAIRSSDGPLDIAVHTAAGAPDEILQRLSLHQANSVRAWMVEQGIPEERMRAVGKGASEPAVSDPRAEANRRVLVKLAVDVPRLPDTAGPAVSPSGAARVWVAGSPVWVDQAGRISTTAVAAAGGVVVLDIRLPSGQRALLHHRLPAPEPAPRAGPADDLRPPPLLPGDRGLPLPAPSAPGAPASDPLAPPPGELGLPPPPPPGGSGGDAGGQLLAQAFPDAPVAPGAPPLPGPPPPAGQPFAPPTPPPPASGSFAPAPAPPAPLQAPPGAVTVGGPDLRGFGEAELEQALKPKGDDDALRKARAAAADLSVFLPPKDTELQSPRLRIHGRTRPGNQIFANDEPLDVAPDGTFAGIAHLDWDATLVSIKSVDPEGNEAVIERAITIAETDHFLLVVADGLAGDLAAELDDVSDQTRFVPENSPVYLHGRAAIYYKGRIKGSKLFQKWFVTAHLDTAKQRRFGQLFEQVIDPDHHYSIYGDDSHEVSEVNAKGPLYLRVDADDSSALIGSFPTKVRGIELFRYDRVIDGARLHVDKEWAEGYRTNARVFGSADGLYDTPGDEKLRPAHDELIGTGGSLYYLEQASLLEGSEQVRLVVRDRDNGTVLRQIPLGRDTDYTIRYDQGRILLKSPLPRTVDAGFMSRSLGPDRSVLSGHRVYLVVDYEHRSTDLFGGESAGGHATQSFADQLTIGGGYVREDRLENPRYSLWSIEGTLTPVDGLKLEGEYAESESGAGLGRISEDGGLTWSPFSILQQRAVDGSGTAMLLRGSADLGELLEDREGKLVNLGAYYRFQEPQFYSYGSLLEAGSEKYGASLLWHVDAANKVHVAHDGGLSDTPEGTSGDIKTVEAERTTLHFRHSQRDWMGTAEAAILFRDETTRPDGLSAVTLAGGATFAIDKGVDVHIRQEAIAGGEGLEHMGRPLLPDAADRLTTTVGLSVEVGEDLWFDPSVSTRWTGEHAITAGFKTVMDDGSDVYVQERMWSPTDREPRDSATVVGASRAFGEKNDNRAYSEYQVSGAADGPRNRSVMGLGRRFRVMPGVRVDGLFERTQVQGSAIGDESHNAVSAGLEWLSDDQLKLTTRFETRVEDRDERAGRADLVQITTLNAIEARLTEDLSSLFRFNFSRTTNESIGRVEARLAEWSAGLAFRPVSHDWFHMLFQYTRRLDRRPGGVLEGQVRETDSHTVAFVPVMETPYRLQLVHKTAFRHAVNRTGDLDEAPSDTLLLLQRLNLHTLPEVDLGLEYRFLRSFVVDDLEHGPLAEVSYILEDLVRVGIGYNFTRFTDNEHADSSIDRGGPFFRVIGQY